MTQNYLYFVHRPLYTNTQTGAWTDKCTDNTEGRFQYSPENVHFLILHVEFYKK